MVMVLRLSALVLCLTYSVYSVAVERLTVTGSSTIAPLAAKLARKFESKMNQKLEEDAFKIVINASFLLLEMDTLVPSDIRAYPPSSLRIFLTNFKFTICD